PSISFSSNCLLLNDQHYRLHFYYSKLRLLLENSHDRFAFKVYTLYLAKVKLHIHLNWAGRPIRQSHFRQVISDKSRSDNAFSYKIISDNYFSDKYCHQINFITDMSQSQDNTFIEFKTTKKNHSVAQNLYNISHFCTIRK
ncbi:hypothetical protein BpHYR1_009458, partial [Brachionus plicatilis]